MKQCFAYIRVSTAKQGEGVSLEAQHDAIVAYAAKNDLSIKQWFEEKETAAKSGRPIFNAMIKQLKAGKASGLIIHKIDRSARNFADWAKIGDLADAGIDVHFATETLDFRSRGGRLSADIQAVIAADYIRNLREETTKGIKGRLEQKLYPFGAPIGYLNNGGGKPKTPDPEKAPLVRDMFELYASGKYSIRSLISEMERRGLRNKNNRPLSKGGIETILSNPFYCGLMRIKTTGKIYQGCHEPLIPASLFKRVQAVKEGKYNKKVTRHNFLFRGFFRCGLCDGAMTPERQKGHVYYRCQTPACPTKTVREEKVDEAIANLLRRCALTKADAETLEREVRAWVERRAQTKKPNTARLQLAKIDARLSSLDDKLIDNVIDDETYKSKRTELFLQRAAIEETQEKDAARAASPVHVRKFLELTKSHYLSYKISPDTEKREIVDMTTSNRFVSVKNIAVDLQNWLREVDTAVAVLCGPPNRTTSRTDQEMRDEKIERLIEIVGSSAVADVETTFRTIREPNVLRMERPSRNDNSME